jgi:biopolymer transport protein ExbD
MVDLAFLLITFFMLTTTLAKPKSMNITMPVGDKPGEVSDKRTLTLVLGSDNKVISYLGLAEKATPQVVNYGRNGLRACIVEANKKVLSATGKSMIVLLKPGKSSIYANLVDAVDELSITGVSTYVIVDPSDKDLAFLVQNKLDRL